MATFIEWLDESIESQKTLVQEYESDPGSEQFKNALEGLERLVALEHSVITIDLDKEERLRSMELKERELSAKIDEMQDRMDIEIKKMIISLGGTTGVIIFLTLWESYGHLFKSGTAQAINTVKRALGL